MKTRFVKAAILAFSVSPCLAQMQSLSASPTGVGATGIVQFNNYSELGQKSNAKIDYNDVDGSCFWKNDWSPAWLILRNGKTIKLKNVKLNFLTNEVHYLDNQLKELIAMSGISRVAFVDAMDSTKSSSIFLYEQGFKIQQPDFFAQVLNEGELKLLKRVVVTISKRDNGVMMKDNLDYRFRNEELYYLLRNGNLIPTKLNKKSVSAIMALNTEDENWLSQAHSKLKNETEVAEFLSYYNQKHKTKE